MSPVSRCFPQLAVEHNRSADFEIAVACMKLTPIVDERILYNHSLWQEKRESRSLLHYRKESKLLSESAMVALFCLFHSGKIFFEVGFVRKGGAVNTGEHLILFVSAPICACNRSELECLYSRGVGHVRACAQVNVIPLLKEGKLLVVGQVVDKLNLVTFACAFHQFDGFLSRQGKAFEL